MTETREVPQSATCFPRPLEEVFAEHWPFLVRTLRRLGVRTADLDDVLQDVFFVVCQRQSDYKEMGRMRAWLYSICTRVAANQLRIARRRREVAIPDDFSGSSDATQLERIEDGEALALGQQLLEKLPSVQREVFVLHEVQHMSMLEIARLQDCALQTAYSRLYKARERLFAEVGRLATDRER